MHHHLRHAAADLHDNSFMRRGLINIFDPNHVSPTPTPTPSPSGTGSAAPTINLNPTGSLTLSLPISLPLPLSPTSTPAAPTDSAGSSTTNPAGAASAPPSVAPTSTPSPPPPFPTPTPTGDTAADPAGSSTTYLTSSDGQVITITSVVNAANTALPASSSTSPAHSAVPFLKNKPLSGAVFGLVGVAGLVLIVIIATMAMRKSRRSKLEREALEEGIDWPAAGNTHGSPGVMAVASTRPSTEKEEWTGSQGGSNHGHPIVSAPPAGYPTAQSSRLSHGDYLGPSESYGQNSQNGQYNDYQAQYMAGATAQQPSYMLPSHGYSAGPAQNQTPYPLTVNTQPPPSAYFNPYAERALPDGLPSTPSSSFSTVAAHQAQPYPPGLQYPAHAQTQMSTSSPTSRDFARRTSMLNASPPRNPYDPDSASPPPSPMTASGSSSGHGSSAGADRNRKRSSYSRELNPTLPSMPASPPLPTAFGSPDEAALNNKDRVLKVANE